MIRLSFGSFIVWLACMILAFTAYIILTAAYPKPEPVKDWCRDESGTPRPMEFCKERDNEL